MSSSPALHRVEWTPTKVARFWDWLAQVRPGHNFFSRQYGPAVLRFAERRGGLAPCRALDIGTGPGHLIGHLLDRGYEAAGFEQSEELAAEANARLAGQSGFMGVETGTADALPFPTASFAAVTCLEVIEHVLEGQVPGFFDEVARVLRPGGTLVISTPNQEDLRQRAVVCPDCGAAFHRGQHVQRWNAERLTNVAREHGLGRVATREVALTASIPGWAKARAKRIWSLASGATDPLPNLLFVARRQPDA
jgi:2-polyprenyl-3-methyl-5-hydroxy-6-metoxy-1,4-benzoquinol methylase